MFLGKKEAKEKSKLTLEERTAVKERTRLEKEKLKEALAAKLAQEKAKLKEIKEQERQKVWAIGIGCLAIVRARVLFAWSCTLLSCWYN